MKFYLESCTPLIHSGMALIAKWKKEPIIWSASDDLSYEIVQMRKSCFSSNALLHGEHG